MGTEIKNLSKFIRMIFFDHAQSCIYMIYLSLGIDASIRRSAQYGDGGANLFNTKIRGGDLIFFRKVFWAEVSLRNYSCIISVSVFVSAGCWVPGRSADGGGL